MLFSSQVFAQAKFLNSSWLIIFGSVACFIEQLSENKKTFSVFFRWKVLHKLTRIINILYLINGVFIKGVKSTGKKELRARDKDNCP